MKIKERKQLIKIKYFLSNTCKICIICLNKYACGKKIKKRILFSGRA